MENKGVERIKVSSDMSGDLPAYAKRVSYASFLCFPVNMTYCYLITFFLSYQKLF